MVAWRMRVAAKLIVILVILTGVGIVCGQQFNRIPDLIIYRITTNSHAEMIYVDMETNIHVAGPNIDFRFSIDPSPDGTMLAFPEVIDNQLLIYIAPSFDANRALLTTIDLPSDNYSITWATDSHSLFVSYKETPTNTELLQVDVATGQVTHFGSYDLNFAHFQMEMLNDQYLFLWGSNGIAAIDVHTGELHQYTAQTYPMMAYFNRPYAAYITNDLTMPDSMAMNIINLETLEVVQIGIKDIVGAPFTAGWSQTEPIIAFAITPDTIMLYNADMQTSQVLPDGYRLYVDWYGWSNDGTRLIVAREPENKPVEYVAVNINTGEETVLQVDPTERFTPIFMWSHDNHYLLSRPNELASRLVYSIYDSHTGELLYTVNEPSEPETRSLSMIWMWQ